MAKACSQPPPDVVSDDVQSSLCFHPSAARLAGGPCGKYAELGSESSSSTSEFDTHENLCSEEARTIVDVWHRVRATSHIRLMEGSITTKIHMCAVRQGDRLLRECRGARVFGRHIVCFRRAIYFAEKILLNRILNSRKKKLLAN